MSFRKQLVASMSALILMACGASEKNKSDESVLVDEPKPEGSTETKSDVSLSFGGLAALSLAGEQAATTVTINEAKFNIAAIKIKPEKEQTAEDKIVEEKEKEEEKEEVTKVESESSSSTASAGLESPKREENQSKERKDRLDRLKGKVAEFKEREKELLEKIKERDKSVKFGGPYIFDAKLGKIESGDLGKVELYDGKYRRMEFKVRRNFTVAADNALFGNSFYVKGKAGESNFTVEVHHAMNFRLLADTDAKAVDVKVDVENKLAVIFDNSKWFEGVKWEEAEKESNGEILINHKSNKDLLKVIRKNIKKSIKFGKDANGDGKLSTDEVVGKGDELAQDEEEKS